MLEPVLDVLRSVGFWENEAYALCTSSQLDCFYHNQTGSIFAPQVRLFKGQKPYRFIEIAGALVRFVEKRLPKRLDLYQPDTTVTCLFFECIY